jgi:nucleotide-binding universal stress UspA family protein
MMIKHIVVQVDQAPAARLRLEAAVALAAHFEAHLTAVYLVPEPFLRGITGYHLPDDVVREHVRHAEVEADTALAVVRETAGTRISFEAIKEVGPLERLPTLFARFVRSADLSVVGEPNRESGGTDDAALVEVAFMDTGRPALVVPQTGAPTLPPRRALVAWDGSREAARAVHDALPLLAAAQDVVILTAMTSRQDPALGRQPGADLAEQLKRHRVAARVKVVQSGDGSIADLIIAQAGEESADLIVMGGYGHSRLRELMLGGVTRHMLERMTLPVLIAH